MADPKSCPFCRCKLTPCRQGTGFNHPRSGDDCILSGWFIGSRNIERWNRRRSVIRYDVVAGELVFSATGAKPATNKFLNEMVAYYKANMK